MKKVQFHPGLWTSAVLLLYLFTHLYRLTELPVFADEAIYIRWAQLIIDDWQRYLFFPLNDGKTPLHMWILVPFISFFSDPLWAGRLVSVIVGGLQMLIVRQIIARLGGRTVAQVFGMMMVTLLPFWVFFHRMALIDSLLTLFLSFTVLGLIQLAYLITTTKTRNSQLISFIAITGISYGCALLTKLPALFLLPIFPLFSQIFQTKWTVFDRKSWRFFIATGVSAGIGLGIFGLLKLHPAFGQLFSRGQDFTFTTQEILSGEWRASLNNLWRILFWHGSYMSYVLTAFALLAPIVSKNRKKHLILFGSLLIFILPFAVFGRVLSSRYVLPMIIFSTVSVSLFFEELLEVFSNVRLVLFLLLIPAFFVSIRFFAAAWFDSDQLPLVHIDREQYIEEWSSGHGIRQMVDIIEAHAQTGKVVVATEGYFGTLPDGLLMYFHNRNVENIEIFGVGQPITQLPAEWLTKAEQAETAFLVVNTHRMLVQDDRLELIYKFPRPGESSSLDVYRLKK